MTFIELLFLSLGLAMDCFAVSCSTGISQPQLKVRRVLLFAFSFGLFQALMPLIGWLCGETVVGYLHHFTHWIAFGLLAFIGGKMIVEGIQHRNGSPQQSDMNRIGMVLMLSVATSIDALAVGFSFSMMQNISIGRAIMVIGITSFILSILGYYLTKSFSKHIKAHIAEIIGGAVLVAIGIKILLEGLLS